MEIVIIIVVIIVATVMNVLFYSWGYRKGQSEATRIFFSRYSNANSAITYNGHLTEEELDIFREYVDNNP